MKKFQICLLFFAFLSCCDDDDAVPQPPPPPACLEVVCETEEEFYGKAIMNGECWVADEVRLYGDEGVNFIDLNKNQVNDIRQGLSIEIIKNANLHDTLWIGLANSDNPEPNLALTYYGYFDSHSSVGEFDFAFGTELTFEDYLLIDYFNADTSIIEGRFQVRFPNRSVNSFVNAPDSMLLGCGSFRVKKD
ncbi:hypothetical protein [Lewinella sp. LCG006]|uniref:hypothetical protein n=1 Tax=Lewinella sp. LCG006 TaxID=3231911 RepID=UPI003460A5B0